MQCSQGLYLTIEAGISKTAPPRDTTNHVSRRHVGDGTDKIRTAEKPFVDHNAPSVSGFCDQPRRVPVDAIPTNPIPGLHDRLQGDEDYVDRTEGGTDCSNMQRCTAEAVLVTTMGNGQSDRQDDYPPASHLPGSIME